MTIGVPISIPKSCIWDAATFTWKQTTIVCKKNKGRDYLIEEMRPTTAKGLDRAGKLTSSGRPNPGHRARSIEEVIVFATFLFLSILCLFPL